MTTCGIVSQVFHLPYVRVHICFRAFRRVSCCTVIILARSDMGLCFQGCYVLYSKRMSPHTNATNMTDEATMATSSQPKHKQVSVVSLLSILHSCCGHSRTHTLFLCMSVTV